MTSLVNSSKYVNSNWHQSPNASKKIKEEVLHNSSYEANITLMPISDKDITRKLQTNTSYEYWCKNPQQNTCKSKWAAFKGHYTPCLSGIYPKNGNMTQNMKTSLLHPISRTKEKRHVIISIGVEKKAFDTFNMLC